MTNAWRKRVARAFSRRIGALGRGEGPAGERALTKHVALFLNVVRVEGGERRRTVAGRKNTNMQRLISDSPAPRGYLAWRRIWTTTTAVTFAQATFGVVATAAPPPALKPNAPNAPNVPEASGMSGASPGTSPTTVSPATAPPLTATPDAVVP